MNYQRIYDSLVNRAVGREIEEYTESHHIIPRCMGGKDDTSNLVDLTPEEHYLAHQLLVKIHPKHPGLAQAAILMTADAHGNRVNNKLFGWLRRKYSENRKNNENITNGMSGKQHSNETKQKIRQKMIGREVSLETKKKQSIAATGKKFTEEHKLNKSIAAKEYWKKRKEQKDINYVNPMFGKTRSPKSIAKMLETRRLNKLKKEVQEKALQEVYNLIKEL